MEPRLIEKLDLMIKRSTGKNKMDNLIVIDGDEGHGKSTLAMQIANYYAEQTNRPFSIDNVFFDIEKLTEFATKTQDQIIVWDEAALAGLAGEWYRKEQQQLIKLLMVARKKRHFWIFNIPKFFKLNEYVLIDRAIALIHVYARNQTQLGRFVYINKSKKEWLWHKYRTSKKRGYKTHYSFRGSFTKNFVVDEEAYDKKKDEAILTVSDKNNPKAVVTDKNKEIVDRLVMSTELKRAQKAEIMNVSTKTVDRMKNRLLAQGYLLGQRQGDNYGTKGSIAQPTQNGVVTG